MYHYEQHGLTVPRAPRAAAGLRNKPVAEKTFRQLTALSAAHGGSLVHLVAVSHSSAEATERWVAQVGGHWEVSVVVDEERELYAQWGLGVGSAWHVLGPRALYGALRLGRAEGIWNRPAESGSRWQTSGAFAIDRAGVVRWAHVAASADDLPDLTAALRSVGIKTNRGRAASASPEVQTSGFL